MAAVNVVSYILNKAPQIDSLESEFKKNHTRLSKLNNEKAAIALITRQRELIDSFHSQFEAMRRLSEKAGYKSSFLRKIQMFPLMSVRNSAQLAIERAKKGGFFSVEDYYREEGRCIKEFEIKHREFNGHVVPRRKGILGKRFWASLLALSAFYVQGCIYDSAFEGMGSGGASVVHVSRGFKNISAKHIDGDGLSMARDKLARLGRIVEIDSWKVKFNGSIHTVKFKQGLYHNEPFQYEIDGVKHVYEVPATRVIAVFDLMGDGAWSIWVLKMGELLDEREKLIGVYWNMVFGGGLRLGLFDGRIYLIAGREPLEDSSFQLF